MNVSGAVNYSNQGTGSGNITVSRDILGINAVNGQLQIPGTSGGNATASISVQRAWILPIWTGEVRVADPSAGVSVAAPVFGSISADSTPNSAKGTSNWFLLGSFPNLIRPFSLSWSVTDAG